MVALVNTYSEAAFGPRPQTVASKTTREELLQRTRKLQSDPRKTQALTKWKIFTQQHKDLIAAKIDVDYDDKTTRSDLRRFISVHMNAAREITRETSVVYKHGGRRQIVGASESEQKAYEALVRESGLDLHAPEWNQIASFIGPLFVVPVVTLAKGLIFDVLLPHFYDAAIDPDDPFGPPIAAAWTIRDPEEEEAIWETFGLKEGTDTVYLDAEAWRYYRLEGEDFREIDKVEHDLGYFPGAEFRISNYEGDRWGTYANQDLVDVTLQIGVINCALGLVRRAQNKKLLMVVGQLTEAAKRQGNYPDRAIQINTKVPGSVRVEAVDFDIDPEKFIKHIRFLYEVLIESRGIPAHNVTFDASPGTGPQERLRLSHGSLTEVRNAQIPFARRFEHDLGVKTVAMARAMKHRLATELPDPEKVRDGFSVSFPPLAREFNDPRIEMLWADWMQAKGARNPLDALRDDPMESLDSLRKRQEENLAETERWHDAVTKRNLSISDGKIQTAAQAFGAQGPKVRDADSEDRQKGSEE